MFGHLTVGMFLGSQVAAGFAQCPAGAAFGRVDHRQSALKRSMALNSASRLALSTISG